RQASPARRPVAPRRRRRTAAPRAWAAHSSRRGRRLREGTRRPRATRTTGTATGRRIPPRSGPARRSDRSLGSTLARSAPYAGKRRDCSWSARKDPPRGREPAGFAGAKPAGFAGAKPAGLKSSSNFQSLREVILIRRTIAVGALLWAVLASGARGQGNV